MEPTDIEHNAAREQIELLRDKTIDRLTKAQDRVKAIKKELRQVEKTIESLKQLKLFE